MDKNKKKVVDRQPEKFIWIPGDIIIVTRPEAGEVKEKKGGDTNGFHR